MLQPSENLKFAYKNEEKILLYFLDLQAFASSKLVCVCLLSSSLSPPRVQTPHGRDHVPERCLAHSWYEGEPRSGPCPPSPRYSW